MPSWDVDVEGFALRPAGKAGGPVVAVEPAGAAIAEVAEAGADAVVLPWPLDGDAVRAAQAAGLGIVADASQALAARPGSGLAAGWRAGRALGAAPGSDAVGLWLVADVEVVPRRGLRFAQFAARALSTQGTLVASFMEDRRAGRGSAPAVFARTAAQDRDAACDELFRLLTGARRLPVIAALADGDGLAERLRLAADLGVAGVVVPGGRLDAVRDLAAFERSRLEGLPKVSVVICAYNAADTIEECLRSVEHLTYPDYEVLVVDDGSTDETTELARRFPFARLVEQVTNQGLSAARNRGAQEATGEFVAYLDADASATPDWLSWAMRGADALRADGITGPNLPYRDAGIQERAVSGAPGAPVPAVDPDGRAEHIAGCNMIFRRQLVLDIGFEPALRTSSDDVRFCAEALERGARLYYHPRATIFHHRRATLEGFLRQQRGYGASLATQTGVENMTWDAPEQLEHDPWHSRLNPFKRRYVFTGGQEHGLYAQREYSVRTAFPIRVFSFVGILAAATAVPALLLGRAKAWAAGVALAFAGTTAWLVAAVPVFAPRRGTALLQRVMTAALWIGQPLARGRGRRQALAASREGGSQA